MKILITGGHVTPALAVIEELQKSHKDVQLVFVGRKYTSPQEHTESFEYQEVTKLGVPFVHLEAGRFSRVASLTSFFHFLQIIPGFVRAFRILRAQKPDKILSFGGYIGLPMALAGSLLSTPVYTHEQTIEPGLANKIIGNVARKVFVAFPQAASAFPADKTIVSGNPMRIVLLGSAKSTFTIPSGREVIFVTGGSLGSHNLNVHIENILDSLLDKYIVIHQTGSVAKFGDFERLSGFKNDHYIVRKHLSAADTSGALHSADVVVSRAGANTVFELIALQKPAVFVPLPWSASGEQQKQAEFMKQHKVAEIFDQKSESEDLLMLIKKVLAHKKNYVQNYQQLASYYKPDCAKALVFELLT